MSEWKQIKLEDFAELITDYVANGSFASLKANVRIYKEPNYALMVKTADFANDFTKSLTYTDRHGYAYLSKSRLLGGELLLSNIGSVGKVFRVPYFNRPMTLASNSIMVRCKEETHYKWLYYFFLSLIGNKMLNSITTGTTMKKFNKTGLRGLCIPVPSDEEQNRIVARIEELFSELDNGVETLRKTKQQLAVYRKAVLKHAFTPEEDWRKATVADIGEVNLGRQRSPKHVSNDYPTKYIRAANITENGLALDDVLEMEFSPEERKKYYLHNGDIVISEASGSASQVGKPAIWRGEIPNCCFQNTVIRHRVISEHPEYVFWYYKYLYVCGYFSKIVGGVGINHLGAKNFASIEVDLAPVEKQLQVVAQIETRLSLCDSIEKTVDTALQQAEAMRQSILKKAFEGRL